MPNDTLKRWWEGKRTNLMQILVLERLSLHHSVPAVTGDYLRNMVATWQLPTQLYGWDGLQGLSKAKIVTWHFINIKICSLICFYFYLFTESESVEVLVTQSCLTLCNPCKPTRLLCPWNPPHKNAGVGSYSLLQGIFSTRRLNLGLLHCRQILYSLNHQGSHTFSSYKHTSQNNTARM